MINQNEITYKMNAIINYLKENNGYNHKVYNHGCSHTLEQPDSNIIEYAEDVMTMINDLLEHQFYNDNNENNIL